MRMSAVVTGLELAAPTVAARNSSAPMSVTQG
jgi:hypothetical protein